MEYRGLRIAKDILLNAFWIGFGMIIVFWLIYTMGRPLWLSMVVQWWHITNLDFINMLVAAFFTLAKFVMFFYILMPALAICWTLRKLEKKSI